MIGTVKEKEGKLYVYWMEQGEDSDSVVSRELPIWSFQSGHVKPGDKVEFDKVMDSYWDPANCDCNRSEDPKAHESCKHFVGGGINDCLKGDSVKFPAARLVERRNIYSM
jgi:hypothetical protein